MTVLDIDDVLKLHFDNFRFDNFPRVLSKRISVHHCRYVVTVVTISDYS